MKYFVLLCDGMADRPVPALSGKTPMQAAVKPTMDELIKISFCGLVSHVPEGMVPESDTANMSVMGFDPRLYSKGRSPLEALAMGIDMQPDETAYRCNIVTVSDNEEIYANRIMPDHTADEESYANRIMLDHSADEITTDEARVLIEAINDKLGNADRVFHTGISYRHCLIWKNSPGLYNFDRPHDIIGQRIGEHLPSGEVGGQFLPLFEQSYEILNHHPVNEDRRARGLKPANSIWLWSPGKKPEMPNFNEKWGVSSAVISAVDLIKGIAVCAGMKPVSVQGATGNIHTNFRGKGAAAIEQFKEGIEFVYVHVEAPDECGHRAETDNKVLAIEKIDAEILKPVYEYLRACGEPFKIMVLPDHPTPLETRTHSSEPVPFFIYNSERKEKGCRTFNEEEVKKSGFYLPHGEELLSFMIRRPMTYQSLRPHHTEIRAENQDIADTVNATVEVTEDTRE